MYIAKISENLKRKLENIARKDKNLHEQIFNKMSEISNSYDIEHYKNLRYGMKDSKRVHIGHFVLVFRFDKINNRVIFDEFEHHDKIYV